MTHTVVHFLDTNTFGGCEEVVLVLLSGLDRNRWRPVLFHHEEPGLARLVNAAAALGIPCRTVPRMTGLNAALTVPRFVRELRAAEAAILHAHLNWPLACRFGLLAARVGRVPGVVATAHLFAPISEARFGALKQRVQAAAIGRYIAVSGEVKERLCGELAVQSSKVRVVHNGIRLAPFERPANAALRAALSGGRDVPVVFTPARLHSQKGHAYLLEAARHIPQAVFVFAGDGPERKSLEDLSQKLGVADRVRFLGLRQDVPDLMAACDVFVLPSLYEGLPLSVLEAMAAGKPVVATAIGGTDEAVVHGNTGLLVPPANAAELAAAIRALLGDKERSARLAAAGRARARLMFSSEAMVQGVSRVYEELV